MTRLFSRFLFISVLLLSLSACGKKDTIINGKVVDAKTGMPIGGVKIIYSLVDMIYETGSNHSIKSDPSGNFTIIIANGMQFYSFQIIEQGYLRKYRFDAAYVKGEVNNVEIKLHPEDATLRIIYENSSGQEKSIYLQAQSNTYLEAYGLLPFVITRPYPYISQPNLKDTLDYPFISDEWVRLYWDFNNFETASQAMFKDSLYLSRGDTSTYIISF